MRVPESVVVQSLDVLAGRTEPAVPAVHETSCLVRAGSGDMWSGESGGDSVEAAGDPGEPRVVVGVDGEELAEVGGCAGRPAEPLDHVQCGGERERQAVVA